MNEELKIIISAQIDKLKSNVDKAKSEINSFKAQVEKASQDVDSKFKKMGDGIGEAVKKGAAVAVSAVASVATAVAGLATASIKNYAEYEQLAGGVEKLFGDSADVIKQYAQDAYKNAGVSANDYMSQVTSFSASLISSLGGDTAAAAEVANVAINDMADNANVFGSNITDIQNAYQGFAKANYTMLDNLKLGYGGTKEEMQRLIDHANDIKVAMGDTADLSIESFADIVEAIHLVQEEMLITGTTANEAEHTISGSIQMTKAAWQNFLTGLAQSNADIPQLVNNVISSATSVLKNIIPVAKEVLKNIPAAISEISPEAGAAMQAVMDFVVAAFPVLISAVQEAISVVSSLFTFFSEHQGLLTAVAAAIGVVVTAIGLYNAAAAVKAAMAAAEVTTLAGLAAAYLAQAAAMAVAIAPYALIAAAIAAVIAIIVVCVKHWDEIKAACANAWEAIKEKTSAAVEAVGNFLTKMRDKATETFNNIKDGAKQKFTQMKETMSTVMEAAKSTVQEKLSNIKAAYEENGGGVKGVVAATMEAIKGYYTAGYTFINTLTNGKLGEMVSQMKSKLDAAKSAVVNSLNNIKNQFQTIFDNAKQIVSNAVEKCKSLMNFSWSLPKLKLPHISISGSFSLNPPSVPKFSISWYKMGGVFDSPTLFGYGNGMLGGLGENGAEAVVPLEKNTMWLDRIATMLNEKQGNSGNRPIYLMVDGRVFGEIAVDSINELTRLRGNLPLKLV